MGAGSKGLSGGGAGVLSVVATPIGNLSDLTMRAVETLRAADVIVAEDTRRTRALLSHLGISGKELVAFHAHSSASNMRALVARLDGGAHLALVSDAGTPVVSDPGAELIAYATSRDIRVVPVPGPSAVLAALVGSGIGCDAGYAFFGFLPRSGPPRRQALVAMTSSAQTIVLFESPRRVAETLSEFAELWPERRACVARELTKVHEEFVRGTLSELARTEREWLGEITVILEPRDPAEPSVALSDVELNERIDEQLAAGQRTRTVAEHFALVTSRPKKELYALVVERASRVR